MHVAAWTLAGIDGRVEEIVAFLEAHDPEVLCLLGTGVADGDFPLVPLFELGYYTKLLGAGAADGVAILAVEPPRDVRRDADVLSAVVAGMRLVVGGGPGLDAHVRRRVGRQERVLVIGADCDAAGFARLGAVAAPFHGRRDVARRCAEVVTHGEGLHVARFTGLPGAQVPEVQPWRQ